ncbi:MAG: hypothetical protein BAA04_01355 [Firmicutes bacterium ZCTH02-B6]|nr:MAG: hypothetical protein BAA04_01355 [Firmicutes bacterium ZCTH02-B6]
MTRRGVSDWIFLALWLITGLLAVGEHFVVRAEERLAQELTRELDRAAAALDEGDWTLALETAGRARRVWETARERLALHAEHQRLEAISEALLEAEALIAARSGAAGGLLVLARERIKGLPEQHRLSWSNLF